MITESSRPGLVPLLDYFFSFFPKLKRFKPYNKLEQTFFKIKDIVQKQIKVHQENVLAEEDPKDFMDIYLREIDSEKKKFGDDYSVETSTFNVKQLLAICVDLFVAGLETTNTTLLWTVMYLSFNKDVQKKCQNEIDQCLAGTL